VLVAHCVLNQNAISDGTADHPGADAALVRRLLDAGVGIVSLLTQRVEQSSSGKP
jgi:hypothetical protein